MPNSYVLKTEIGPAIPAVGRRAFPVVQGVPSFLPSGGELAALYLWGEGTNGNAVAGPWADSSGNGATATLYGGRASPIKQPYGLRVTDTDGLVIQTGVDQAYSFCIIGSFAADTAVDVEQFLTFFGSNAGNAGYGIPAAKGDTHNNTVTVYPNIRGDETASVQKNSYGLLKNGFSVRLYVPESRANGKSLQIVSFKVRADTGTASLKPYVSNVPLNGVVASWTDASVSTMYPPALGKICIGLWPAFTHRPATGAMGPVAIYTGIVSDNDELRACRSMAKLLADRGVNSPGWVGYT